MSEREPLIEAVRDSVQRLRNALDDLEPPLSATDRQAVIQAALPLLLSARPPEASPTPQAREGRTSPAAIVLEAGARSQSDQALCLAWFSYHQRGEGAFTSAQLEGMFQEARLRPPGNASDVVLKLCKRGLLAPAEAEGTARKAYVISSHGDEQVAAWLAHAERAGR
jgi:hypothetical protein